VSDYEKLAPLGLQIEELDLERRELPITDEFKRVTTTVILRGGGHTGEGEDVTYMPAEHEEYPRPDLAPAKTIDEFSRLLEPLQLPDYRRWAFESAALDLALRQAGLSLGEAVGRAYRPVRFVVSTRADIREWLERQPSLEFKVDPMSEWTREQMEELASTGRVRVADLKGYYRGTPVDQDADPRLYRDVVEVFHDAVIEDAAFTDETREILAGTQHRLSFDAPIHSVADVEALEIDPRFLNIKPSRFGTLRRLFETLAYAQERQIRMYGGGQFELGPGRSHIQALASLYYPDAPNDTAPSVYNEPGVRDGLPASPLAPPATPRGLSFAG
jgi:hypothetical protein